MLTAVSTYHWQRGTGLEKVSLCTSEETITVKKTQKTGKESEEGKIKNKGEDEDSTVSEKITKSKAALPGAPDELDTDASVLKWHVHARVHMHVCSYMLCAHLRAQSEMWMDSCQTHAMPLGRLRLLCR